VTLDLAVTYRVLRYLKVFARVNNLANDQYENPLGYLQPGRAGYAGFTVSY
ncbi:MAG: TonB-dependent receptor, partial [Acetobacter sp.]|nr:TonB-dependent receptor [Acetobacter sp.]MBQ5516724.1 TonB-dependent receptor [Acetobacter sp.]